MPKLSYTLDQDVDLSVKLFKNQLIFLDKAEFARVTGLPLKWILSRGQQIRTISALLRMAKVYSLLLPIVGTKTKLLDANGKQIVKAKQKYKGATVVSPFTGFYACPVATLDFSSLYPSIMQAYNLSYDTLIPKELLHLLKEHDYLVFKNELGENAFTKQSVREGILTMVLTMYISKRNVAKSLAARHKGTYKAAIFDNRQNALKASANSVYGATGTESDESALSEKAIGSVVTERGRVGLLLTAQVSTRPLDPFPVNHAETEDQYHERVKTPEWPVSDKTSPELIAKLKKDYYKNRLPESSEQHRERSEAARNSYPIPRLEGETDEHFSKRLEANIGIIYGDTDSVMVAAGLCKTAGEAIALFTLLANWISKWFFFSPMKYGRITNAANTTRILFEKIYYPYYIMNKKRYAGIMWTSGDKPLKKYPDVKGLESTRRDNAPIASKLVFDTLNALLLDKSPVKAVMGVISVMQELHSGTVDLSKLIVSKALAKEASDYTTTAPHVTLTKRMQKRDLASAPRMGDRVPYLMVARGGDPKKTKAHCKSEDPTYSKQGDSVSSLLTRFVINNNIPIDVTYYIENQLRKPVARLLEPLMPGITDKLFSTTPCTVYVPATVDPVAYFGPPKVRRSLAEEDSEDDESVPKKAKPKAPAEPRPAGWTKAPNRHLVGGQTTLFGEIARPLGEKVLRPQKRPLEIESLAGQKRIDDPSKFAKAPVADVTKPKPGYTEIRINYKIAVVSANSQGDSIGRFGLSLMNCLACEARMDASCFTPEELEPDVAAPVCIHCRNAWSHAGLNVDKELAKIYEQYTKKAAECKKNSDEKWAKCARCKGVESVEELMLCAAKECSNFYPRSSAKALLLKTEESSRRIKLLESIAKAQHETPEAASIPMEGLVHTEVK